MYDILCDYVFVVMLSVGCHWKYVECCSHVERAINTCAYQLCLWHCYCGTINFFNCCNCLLPSLLQLP